MITLSSLLPPLLRVKTNLSRDVNLHRERLVRARQARENFKASLEELEGAKEDIKETEAWHMWHDEAQRGFDIVNEHLVDLGEEQ